MTETRVNTYTSGSQGSPAVAIDDDGDFVVVWASYGQDGSNNGVYAQRFNADGTPAGAEFLVNTTTSNSQTSPDVAMNADGDFVVTWDSSLQDGSGAGVYAQRFSADGVAQGSEFRVNTYTSSGQSLSSVAMDDDGDFVVVWGSSGQDGNGYGVYAQRYNTAGVAQGGEFLVNTYTSGTQGVARVAMDADGDFVVVWNSSGQDGNSNGVYAQRYNAAGVAQGSEFRVNTYTSSSQSNGSVDMDADGDFVIAWVSSGQDGSGNGIYAQRYAADGTPQGAEFLVNTTTSNSQATPKVAMHENGDFVVTWTSNLQDGSSYGVYAQRYQADGVPIGTEFRVNTTTSNSQNAPDVAFSDNGDAVFVWASSLQDGSSGGVYMDTYDSLTCFLRGTRIATDRGEVPVEALNEGDLVQTRFGGARPIRWIGMQCFDGRFAGPDYQPVRFHAGSLGAGLPHSDLFVSPGHAMLVDEVLAHAGLLVNDVTITRTELDGLITYFHLDLGAHDCVRANGAWAESYFEDENRHSFHNAAEFHARFPGHVPVRQQTCLPIVDAGHACAGWAHARLAPRLGRELLSEDADVHFLVDGRRVEPAWLAEDVMAVALPPGMRELRLRSRATRPSMALGGTDHRRLGVMVQAIALDEAGQATPIALDHPALCRGFHPAETDGTTPWRWTDGDAAIPMPILGTATAPRRLMLRCVRLPANFIGATADLPAVQAA